MQLTHTRNNFSILESKNIELPKEPQADLEINKKRTLRSPAQKPANELAKRTKLDRSGKTLLFYHLYYLFLRIFYLQQLKILDSVLF